MAALGPRPKPSACLLVSYKPLGAWFLSQGRLGAPSLKRVSQGTVRRLKLLGYARGAFSCSAASRGSHSAVSL